MAGTLLFNALREAIDEEMGRDPVCVMGEDVGHYGGSYKVTKDLAEKYGDLRVLDADAENGFTGMAVGAAMTGLRPIVEGMNMGFLLLAFNQISNNMGMLRYTSGGNFTIPTVVRGPGGVGRQLGAEHSQRLEAYFHAVPGIKIVACSTPTNAKGLMKAAIRDNNPVLFFEHVLLYNLSEDLPEGDYTCALDQADLVKEGTDVTILTYSRMRHHCLKAVEQLEADGISVELIDLISLKPFDMETISRSIRKTHKVIVVEECMKTGGIGAELIALITEQCFDDLDAAMRLSSQDVHALQRQVGKPDDHPAPSIVETVQRWCSDDPAAGWLALILALAIGNLLVLRSPTLSLGLDLQGGSQQLLVKPAGDIARWSPSGWAVEVLERRVNGLGVSEASVTTSGSDRIVVQLPAFKIHAVRPRCLAPPPARFRAQKPPSKNSATSPA